MKLIKLSQKLGKVVCTATSGVSAITDRLHIAPSGAQEVFPVGEISDLPFFLLITRSRAHIVTVMLFFTNHAHYAILSYGVLYKLKIETIVP
jgi:hypothetical protein